MAEPEATPDAAPQVFISYASQDAALANDLVATLEKAGLRCWIAPRDVTPGAQYAEQIVRAINDTDVLVLVLSGHSAASAHVGREIERASSKGRRIVALRTDATILPPALEYFLSQSQWIDLEPGGHEAAAKKLLGAIHRYRSPQSHAEAPGPDKFAALKPRSAVPRRRSVLWGVAGAVLVAMAVLNGHLWFQKGKQSTQQSPAASAAVSEKSIAVLPFTDLSEKKDQEYFADGMAEEVLDQLANIPGLKVISRTSSFQFKGKNPDLRTVGTTLGVNYVVEGSVRRAGEHLRVTAQLINAQDGAHLWSESYDEPAGDTLKVQDQIALNLARALQVTVGADSQHWRPVFKTPEAHDLYLRGRHASDRGDREGFDSATADFQQLLALDPTSVAALQGLAVTQFRSTSFGYLEPKEGFEGARSSAQRALALDPLSSGANVVLTGVALAYDWDWAAAERYATESVRLAPHNPDSLGAQGAVDLALGRWEAAIRNSTAALTLDPLSATWYMQLSNAQIATGRLTEAAATMQKILQIAPTFGEGHYSFGLILLLQGNAQRALAEMQKETSESARNVGLTMVYHALGRHAESNAALAQVIRDNAQDEAWEIADAYAYRGELDQAFAWLDRAYRQKDAGLYLIKCDGLFRNLTGDPRYKAFLEKMNLPD